MKLAHSAITGCLLALLAACAQGSSGSDLGSEPVKKTAKDPTEPEAPSITVPSKGSDDSSDSTDSTDDGSSSSSGSSSSGGSSSSSSSSSSSGGSSSGGSSSGGSSTSSGGSSSGGSSSGGSSTSSSGGSSGSTGSCTTVAPSNACGLTPQCGCATNQTCDVTNTSTGAVSCVSAGTKAQGSPCTGTGQCAVGLTCAYGTCRPHCETDGAACTGSGLGKCGGLYTSSGTAVPNGNVCSINCDLRNPSGACGTNTCIWDSVLEVTDCDQSAGKALYAACSTYNDCGPGMGCANHPTYGLECESWCRVGHDEDCGMFELCEDVYGSSAPVVGGSAMGHCQ